MVPECRAALVFRRLDDFDLVSFRRWFIGFGFGAFPYAFNAFLIALCFPSILSIFSRAWLSLVLFRPLRFLVLSLSFQSMITD